MFFGFVIVKIRLIGEFLPTIQTFLFLQALVDLFVKWEPPCLCESLAADIAQKRGILHPVEKYASDLFQTRIFWKKLQTLLLCQSTWPHASFIFSVIGTWENLSPTLWNQNMMHEQMDLLPGSRVVTALRIVNWHTWVHTRPQLRSQVAGYMLQWTNRVRSQWQGYNSGM